MAWNLGVSDGMPYRWHQKYSAEGDKNRFATLEEENKSLWLRNAELAIKTIGSKASAYFCKPPQVICASIKAYPEHAVAKVGVFS